MTKTLSADERYAAGVRARQRMTRRAHAAFDRNACPANPLEVLARSEQGRIPKLIRIRRERMKASPFGFFRGAVPIMAADLASHPHTGVSTQLCGDAHVLNLGAYASFDGRLVFDINDFDETIRGPFEWDIKRLATSLILAGREAGVKRADREDAVSVFTAQYRRWMHEFAAMPVLDLARWQIHRFTKSTPLPAILRAAERATPQKLLEKLMLPASAKSRGGPKFRSEPPLLTPVTGGEADAVLKSLGPYEQTLAPERRHFLAQYTPRAVAFKVVGTGSIGLRDYCVYFEGSHLASRRAAASATPDPLFLQIKEEPASAYAEYLPKSASAHTHQGHRVVDGQRAMQFTSDPFLGYTSIDGHDFLVRQLNDHKASLDIATLTAASLRGYADVCGELFARGHARAGDPIMISGYLGNAPRFDRAILAFAHAYADKTEQDWGLLKKA